MPIWQFKFCSSQSVFNYLLHFDANFRPKKIQVGRGWVRRLAKKTIKNPPPPSFLVSINIWFVLVVVSVIFLIFRINVMAWLHP